MGKVWLEDLVSDDWMRQKLDPAKGLTQEDVEDAMHATKVPMMLQDPPLLWVAAEGYSRKKEE